MRSDRWYLRLSARLRTEERGFTLIETVVSIGVIFVALTSLAYTATIGFAHLAIARERQSGNQIANLVLEQVRGLTYGQVKEGLSDSDLAGDANIVSCPDGAYYYKTCPAANPSSEKLVHTAGLSNRAPLVPHVTAYGPPSYVNTYTAKVYVTQALNVPTSGAYRVTVEVSWTNTEASGTTAKISSQTLVYSPDGTTDTNVNPVPGVSAPFFYGTSSLSRGSGVVTPNAGVSGGTGVAGLSTWDSLTEDLYSLDANIQQQTLTKVDGQATVSGARKVVSGVETIASGTSGISNADDDPNTASGTYSTPGALTQAGTTMALTGGGNSLQVQTSYGAPCVQPNPVWFTGFEVGTLGSQTNSTVFNSTQLGTPTLDSTVKHYGSYSMKLSGVTTYAQESFSPALTTAVVRAAIRFTSLPSATDINKIIYAVPNANIFELDFNGPTQKLRLKWGSSSVLSSTTITAGTWYVIDLRVAVGTSAFTADWRVNGTAQTQLTLASAAASIPYIQFGLDGGTTSWTMNFDDLMVSGTAADYPLPDTQTKLLVPDGMGTSVGPLNFAATNGTIGSTTYQVMDELPPNSSADYVTQSTASGTSYVEMTMQNTTDTCIEGVNGIVTGHSLSTQTNNGKFSLFDGSTERVIYSGNFSIAASGFTYFNKNATVAPVTAKWSQAELNALIARFGYSTDVNPQPAFDALTIEYAVPSGSGGGGSGTETGTTVSTTAATAANVCASQVDSKACSYASESMSSTTNAYLNTTADLTGSGGSTCTLYSKGFVLGAGSASYAYGRRTAGSGGDGTLKEEVVRYMGAHSFADLCAMVSPPVNWPGYYVKFDAGSSATSAVAEAGVGSSAPSFTKAGTITYYDSSTSSVKTWTWTDTGGAITIPAVSVTSNGWKIDLTASLSTSPSYVSQDPPGAFGTGTRYQARAVLGAPLVGTITYKVTNTTTSTVVMDVTLTIDLGTLTAYARYQAGS